MTEMFKQHTTYGNETCQILPFHLCFARNV